MKTQENRLIGIDIGGTSIKFALMDDAGTIEKKWSIPTNIAEKGKDIPNEICASIRMTLEDAGLATVKGIGIGVPGPISPDGKTVVQAVNLDWKDLPLKEIIETDLGIGVCLLNDANAAALGEMWKGAAQGNVNLLFVTLGTGVGGGIVLNGEVLNGCHSSGGEIGHIPIRSDEQRLCGCGGRNCLETFASANGLALSMRKKLVEVNETWREITPPMVFEKAAQKNVHAQAVLAEFVDILGQALAGIMNTIDVEEIVIGGGLSEAGEQLLLPLTEKLEEYVFPQIKAHFSVKKAQLGNEAGIYGAVYAYLIKNKIV
ncbi:ROK family protein [Enterococcus avium]|uniref:ROK family protein n=1 Tax=Enterococcus avium TaxID=33945 RepID=UPI001A973CD7|nr:ROK family protein [Enterococcus avium]MBN2904360.1 ROK family protein [Enterococcus sp.]MBO1139564.1 ROK family protein [Enterococcus avium]MDT2479480.1 ROK family protein [Enterococcus avium]